ncbi:hypothetical protein ICC18_13610 [Paenibacillus sp. WST5]|uniref:Uncharacterized protein n=1 Tax=Paenibacillus sedimenti TaxID=2770274 RepID=A0A926KQN7_9BACL|nr:hypothetical protein [Paenibacillus sedimenti]
MRFRKSAFRTEKVGRNPEKEERNVEGCYVSTGLPGFVQDSMPIHILNHFVMR